MSWLSVSVTTANKPFVDMVAPIGYLNRELVPNPFAEPTDEPANVVTDAVDITIWRIRWLKVSATKAKEPSGEMVTPKGRYNWELVPTPFAEPSDEPANVVTEAVDIIIWRIRWLLLSAIKAKESSGEILTANGSLNWELVPTPFAEPSDEPANLVTEAVEMIIWRIRWLLESAIKA
jgi:hypothetical protein